MRPAFSNALYYPTIDIQNTNWLKTAILFWDSISTIVPESLNQPYKRPDTQYLADIGFLRPLFVNSDDESVVSIEEDIINLIHSSEILQRLFPSQAYKRKMSSNFRSPLNQPYDFGIYGEKMSWKMRHELESLNRYLNSSQIYYLSENFFYIYMTALANKLCEDYSLGMITDNAPFFDICNPIRFGKQTRVCPAENLKNSPPQNQQLAQGLLLDFIIKGISISSDTAFADIIFFKEHHQDELGRFRTQLAKLTQSVSIDKPIKIIRQEINDLYNNEFMPAYNDFIAALADSRIKYITENFLKVSALSTSATSVPIALLGLPMEQALLASMGVSVIASAVSYSINKKRFLRENPYSYLLSINRDLIHK